MTTMMTNKQSVRSPDEGELGRYIAELLDHRKLIITITSCCTLLAVLYGLLATPVYRADALIQVEQKQGNAILDSLSQMLPDSQPISAPEISLIQSRMVVGQTVDDLNLRIQVHKKYFPLVGKGIARLSGEEAGTLTVAKLRLSTTTDIEPGKAVITVIDSQNFSVDYDDQTATGRVGQPLNKAGLSLLVEQINAQPGERFIVKEYTRLAAVDRLQSILTVADQGKDTGMLELELTGDDKKKISRILDNLSYHYLAQNIDREAAQDAKSLQFLNQQLPQVRSELDHAEDKLNAYRQQKDSVDLSLEAKSVLDQVVNVDNQLNELTFREAEVSQLYTKEHPTYKALLEKRSTLEQQKAKLTKQVSLMPSTQQEVLRLSRDVESGRAVYMQLLNRQQELSIAKSSAIGNVRIVDAAVAAPKPVRPQKILLTLAGAVLGFILSVSVILLRIFFHRGIDSADQLEQAGLHVYASIPKSEWLKSTPGGRIKSFRQQGKNSFNFLAAENPADLAIEAIRSLRTSLHFNMQEANNNVVMISGATPEAGKTFISSNLAAIMSLTRQRVLLIDADMRRGTGHKVFGVSNATGLAEVLSGEAPFPTAITRVQKDNYDFDFLPRGKTPVNPAERLMGPILPELIKWASNNYDLVIIDTPPVLAVTDAVLIGKHIGTLLLVARYQTNTVREIELSIKRFTQCNITVQACVLNMITNSFRNYYTYGYGNNTYAYDETR
ncbi:polysaccharide biosynthesis tyrosine autokinase [Pantoea dispersa]|uniref:polysaccharide biosynthesis tyrosine autokinase n=1 Tax=Pantoea dispersa TaxID=59814 RepID=UPI000FDC155E|nr:polysaccharide biosynthesis tyrosine autokinase [Pantoea dispersa]RVU74599.1 polysaccharide biosynthesis tyrosine autokinase [Pantoea dispersa]